MKTKICLNCNKEKELVEFYKDKTRKDGLYVYCKDCSKIRIKKIYKSKKEKKIEYQKKYYQQHKEEKRKYDILYKQKTKAKRNAAEKNHYNNDVIYKFKKQCRNSIYKSFIKKGFYKPIDTQSIIGCNYKTFINHLLETYKKNYNEEYNMNCKVHIDHIKPLSLANTIEEVKELCHYTNLQLLKAKDNLVKSNKFNG